MGVIPTVTSVPGMMPRALPSLNGYDHSARHLFARSHAFTFGGDPDRFYEMQLLLAGAASADRDWGAPIIAPAVDYVLPFCASVADRAWISGINTSWRGSVEPSRSPA